MHSYNERSNLGSLPKLITYKIDQNKSAFLLNHLMKVY